MKRFRYGKLSCLVTIEEFASDTSIYSIYSSIYKTRPVKFAA